MSNQIEIDNNIIKYLSTYSYKPNKVVDALIEIPGLEISVEYDEFSYLVPTALIKFTNNWNGPSRDTVLDNMANGSPQIYLHSLGNPDELAVDPNNLDEEEIPIIIERLRKELLSNNK